MSTVNKIEYFSKNHKYFCIFCHICWIKYHQSHAEHSLIAKLSQQYYFRQYKYQPTRFVVSAKNVLLLNLRDHFIELEKIVVVAWGKWPCF